MLFRARSIASRKFLFPFLRGFANDATTKTASISAIPPPAPAVPPTAIPATQKIIDTFPVPKHEIETTSDSFDNIPGPQSLRSISQLLSKFPITGITVQYILSTSSQLSWNPWLFKRLFDEYGPIVRLYGPIGGDVVLLGRPEHIEEVFKNEGSYPIRSGLQSVEKYRLEYRKVKYLGPFLMFGPNWAKVRESIQVPLTLAVKKCQPRIEHITEEFVARIQESRNKQDETRELKTWIQKWSLESLFYVILQRKLHFMDPCGLSKISDLGIILEGLNEATRAIQKCERGLHLWRLFKTPSWNNLVKHCDAIEWVLGKYVKRVQDTLSERKTVEDLSLLESMLLSKNGIMAEDAITIILDLILIGVNTTTHAISFLLYHLARYPRCQRKLYEQLLHGDETYLKACIKESLRLKPPLPILSRIVNSDLTIDHYHIPKGTQLLMITNLDNLKEEFFNDATRFVPERWLEKNAIDGNMFASIPFGYGAKSCIAQELAELQMQTFIKKVLSKFRIEYYYGDINSTNTLLAQPDRELKFRFILR